MDALTDVYALGCLLFESLTGEAPFASLTGGGAMMAHVDAPPPSVLERRPDLPPELDAVVRRAMAKDPAERYPSAGDLGEAALAAAGGKRRASAESVIATGDALPQALREAGLGIGSRTGPTPMWRRPGVVRAGYSGWVLPIGVLGHPGGGDRLPRWKPSRSSERLVAGGPSFAASRGPLAASLLVRSRRGARSDTVRVKGDRRPHHSCG